MRLWLFILGCTFISAARADFDPGGDPVDWIGQIVTEYRSGEDTCFELKKSADTPNQASPDKFKTCVFGYYDPARFSPGQWLEVKGILQPANADKLPLILGAHATLTDAPMPYYPVYMDTWGGMWGGPGFGPGFGPWGMGMGYPFNPYW
ncbi:MAG TPA: hypothetical protein VFN66_01980 [Burkholderiales bacterium]|nr:hypothetical protein [Burkholderiales bacterium]